MYLAADEWLTIIITDDNDHPPIFPVASYELTIPEAMPPGSSVMALTAEDEDIGDNAKLDYTITVGDPNNNFYMDSIYVAGTGVVKIENVGGNQTFYLKNTCLYEFTGSKCCY